MFSIETRFEIKRRVKKFVYAVANASLKLIFGDDPKKRTVVGFGPANVPANTTVTLNMAPGTRFRGDKIISTAPDSTQLFIQSLIIGNKPQLPTLQNAIALAVFQGNVLDNELLLDMCEPWERITFQIQNTSKEDKMFSASILGDLYLP